MANINNINLNGTNHPLETPGTTLNTGSQIDLTQYNSGNPYITPSEGYVYVSSSNEQTSTAFVDNIAVDNEANWGKSFFYVKKGMRTHGTITGSSQNDFVVFVPLI